jgi:hypothetical protein
VDDKEAKIERQCVEYVFSLTGGELDDKPRVVYDDPACTDERTFRYTYDGAPEYDSAHARDFDHTYMTVVSCCAHGSEPEALYEAGTRWTKVATFSSSGETECPCAQDREEGTFEGEDHEGSESGSESGAEGSESGAEEGTFEGEDHEGSEDGTWCPLCETDASDDNHYIYIGDGWAETVYVATPTCETCHADLVSHKDYGDDRCLTCDPYRFAVKAEGAGAYDGGNDLVYEGSDPAMAEASFVAWSTRCDVTLELDGEVIREDTAYTREKAIKAKGLELISRAESYGGEVDYRAFHAYVAETSKSWDDASGAYGFWWGYLEAATTGPCSRVEVKDYLDGRLIVKVRGPLGGRSRAFEDGMLPPDAYKRVVSVYVWARTGKIKDWYVGSPGTYALPDGRTFTAEEVTDDRGNRSVRTVAVKSAG